MKVSNALGVLISNMYEQFPSSEPFYSKLIEKTQKTEIKILSHLNRNLDLKRILAIIKVTGSEYWSFPYSNETQVLTRKKSSSILSRKNHRYDAMIKMQLQLEWHDIRATSQFCDDVILQCVPFQYAVVVCYDY